MFDKNTLNQFCTLCNEPRIKVANIQRRLMDRTFLEMALDLGTHPREEVLANLDVVNSDLNFLMDGDYKCVKCGNSLKCVYCGVEIHFPPGKNETACPECRRDYMFMDLEDLKQKLKMQYDAEMAAKTQ